MTRRSFLRLICSVAAAAAAAAMPVQVPTPQPPPIKPFSDRKRMLICIDDTGSITDEELRAFVLEMKKHLTYEETFSLATQLLDSEGDTDVSLPKSKSAIIAEYAEKHGLPVTGLKMKRLCTYKGVV